MRGGVVVGREEPVKASAVAEHSQRLLRLPVSRRQHQQEHTQVLGNVARAERCRLLEDQRALARRQIKLLAVGVVTVLERFERLVVDLRRRHYPQHQAAPAVPEVGVDEIDHPRRQQRLAAPGRDLQTEGGKLLAESVATGEVRALGRSRGPRPLGPVEAPVRVLAPRRPVFALPPR